MSEGQSQRSVTSSAQHRQEAEVAATEERERAAAEIAATAARAARLAMVELATARAEVEAAAAAAAELEALHGSSISSFVSANGGTNDELKLAREAAREQAARWAATHPQGRVGGWVDGDRDFYRRCGSPSPDRYHGHHGIQIIVRDVGPSVGWPTLTNTNYVEWAAVMIWLQVRHMWEAVWYGDVDYYEDRRALDALIAAVSPEMQFSLSKKRTAKEVWDAIAAARIDSDRARKLTL
jgi:hypothetical protein